MKQLHTHISPGTTVSFDDGAEQKTGLVASIQTDISNGAKIATVGMPCGTTVALPINHLRQEEPQ